MATKLTDMEEIEELKCSLIQDILENLYEEVHDSKKYKELYEDFLMISDNSNAHIMLDISKQEMTHAEMNKKVLESLIPPDKMEEMLDNPFTYLHQQKMDKMVELKRELELLR